MRRVLLALLLLASAPAQAGKAVWVEVTGHALQSGPTDTDSARRRALADALLQAALAGGASVTGHTAVDKSVVTADLLIVRPVGRVLEHQVTALRQTPQGWQVTIRARVGAESVGTCPNRRRLVITAYQPGIRVSANAPAWAEPLGQAVANELVEALGRHRAVEHVRTTQRALPQGSAAGDAYDYVALTRGSVRLPAGEHAFLPAITLEVDASGARSRLVLTLDLSLLGGTGEVAQHRLTRTVALPGPSPLGRAAALVEPNPRQMADRLTRGLDADFSALLDRETCKPVLTRLAVSGDTITAPVGRRMGLTKGAIGFTVDGDASTGMLEIVSLGQDSATLKPLDPAIPASRFAGRPVRFAETGL